MKNEDGEEQEAVQQRPQCKSAANEHTRAWCAWAVELYANGRRLTIPSRPWARHSIRG